MRSIWKGNIKFAVVTIPAKLYSPTDDKRVSFHQIHGECGSRIQMPKWCPKCERKVEASELAKGYELAKDQHIILEESDFESLPLKSVKTIEVVEFVDQTKIDILAFSDSYYLTCEDVGTMAFQLVREVMATANLVAIARLTYREREHLSVVRPYNGIMLLQTLHYADEVRDWRELKPREVTVSDRELEMALMLVKAFTVSEFEHTKYHDNYREALEKLIEAKMTGQVLQVEAEQKPVTDIAEALMASLKMVGVK